MIGIDTNVLVRYIVHDDQKQAQAAAQLIERTCNLENPGFINHIVLCELGWVLESNYHLGRGQISAIIEQLLQTSQLEIMEPDALWRTLDDYKTSTADFADHLIARTNQSRGCDTTVTLDKKAALSPTFQLLK